MSVSQVKGSAATGRHNAAGWAFAAPCLILLTSFMVVPFGLAFALSFTNLQLISPLPLEFVGLRNYVRVAQDEVFWQALRNNALWVVVVVPTQTGLALWLATLVNRRLRGTVLFRSAYFAPLVTVSAVSGIVWRLLYAEDAGLINGVLRSLTGGTVAPDWLGSTSLALPAVMVASIWRDAGFYMVILLAGLQGIPENLYEAAGIDGASPWQQFRYVTLPQLRNTLVFVITIGMIFAFRQFDEVFVMTRGGPLDATETMMLRLVETGFAEQNIAQGSAIATIFFLLVLGVAMLQRRLTREEREVE
jgi:multiple sugar transport system permease protein